MTWWSRAKEKSDWHNGYIEWKQNDTVYISVVFSWYMQKAYQQAIFWQSQGYDVVAGGPAVNYRPSFLAEVATIRNNIPTIHRHNPNATFTTRGCIRKCPFCIVPQIEGKFRELDNWEPRPIICDNNFLACSDIHFGKVIDSLKSLQNIDFNQGLDARLLTKERAQKLIELNLRCLRLAWDTRNYESQFMRAFQILRDVDYPASKIWVYALVGFQDTPDDTFDRLKTIANLGMLPFPMRYQPLDTPKKNSFVGDNWTDKEIKKMTRYWMHQWLYKTIPWEEFDHTATAASFSHISEKQLALV